MAPNYLNNINQFMSSSSSLNPQYSNAPNLARDASISGSIAVYIVDEYKYGYLQPLSFSTDEEKFLTVVATLLLTLSQKEYEHLILEFFLAMVVTKLCTEII